MTTELKSQIFITLDSLRWDVFVNAATPFLDSLGVWRKAFTPGSWTLPAHAAFFVGKLPQTFDHALYCDTLARDHPKDGSRKPFPAVFWSFRNPNRPRKTPNLRAVSDGIREVAGRNIIEGFSNCGYCTIGTGAVEWFNPDFPAGKYLFTDMFQKFRFFDRYPLWHSAVDQNAWVIEQTNRPENQPFFLFINYGEAHHPFTYPDCPWINETGETYGDRKKCLTRQTACIEYLDARIKELFAALPSATVDLVICADHGEAMGEPCPEAKRQGWKPRLLWGHQFHHSTILEVPLLIETDVMTGA